MCTSDGHLLAGTSWETKLKMSDNSPVFETLWDLDESWVSDVTRDVVASTQKTKINIADGTVIVIRPIENQVGLAGLRVLAVSKKDSSSSFLAMLTPISFALGGTPFIMLFFGFVTRKVIIYRYEKRQEMDQLGTVVYRTAAHGDEVLIHGRAHPGYPGSDGGSQVGSNYGESYALNSYAASSYQLGTASQQSGIPMSSQQLMVPYHSQRTPSKGASRTPSKGASGSHALGDSYKSSRSYTSSAVSDIQPRALQYG
jgi:hypothetical protein